MSGRLQSARERIRRFQLIVGVGFVSCVVGLLLSFAVASRVSEVSRAALGFAPLQVAISQLWEIAVLPVVFYGVARFVDLAPWRSGIGAVLTGELFLAALAFLTGRPWMDLKHPLVGTSRVAFIALGMFETAWAIRRGRSASARKEAAARGAAEQKKSQYDEFVREAERIAALRGEPAESDRPLVLSLSKDEPRVSEVVSESSGGAAEASADPRPLPKPTGTGED